MSGDSEAKANQYIQEAQKKLNASKSFLGGLFGGSSRVEEAIELYIKGANLFKMAKKWMAAGNAFTEAASLHLKSGSKHDAASCYVDAGNCYKKVDPQEAVNSILKAIEIYTDMGRFSIAAKHHMTVAEIYENEAVDIEKAIAHFEQAADYYKGEESSASANRCLLNVARYAAQLEQYSKAIGIYESVASSSIDNSLLKYSAKEHFFRAALCHLCVDLLNAQLAIKRYEEMYPAFSDSRECKFVKGLLDKLEESDVEGFTQLVQEYDSISRLDQWFTTILLKIKKQIQQEPDLK
ncbi:alpha-soluble NSF attachment protein [Tetranychus urticae]|uniref:Soluble NSF attachment protein n=1 Tax=Tetranychus urticae TaxID=32264 RepID=T1K7S9_TETUR|nr:alpha-soluble NSF attachment protein [Tetranychus urticae]